MDSYIVNFNKSLRLGLISFAKREKKRFLLSLLIFSFLASYFLVFLPSSTFAANPVAEIQTKVHADHPEAVVVERDRNSIKHRIADTPDGKQRYILDLSIGPLHYGPDNNQEIDTAFVPSTVPWDWEMTKAGFEVRALSQLNAGQVVEYRDPDSGDWVRFQPMALQYSNDLNQIQQIAMPGAVQATVDDDTLIWTDGYGPGLTLSWQAQTARLAKLLTIGTLADLPAVEQYILDGGNAVLELNLIFAFSGGVTPYVNGQPWSKGQADTQGLVEFRDGNGNVLWWFNLPRSWDADGNEQIGMLRFKKQGNSLYVSHRVPLGFVQGAAYPLMVDVTIDEDVSLGADDGYWEPDCSGYNNTNTTARVGDFFGINSSWYMFRNISGLSGATISVSYIEIRTHAGGFGQELLSKISAEDVASSSPPTDCVDANDKTRTTGVDWDKSDWAVEDFNESPSINSVIQELANSYNPSTILILHEDDGSAATDGMVLPETYEDDPDNAPQLHIEYTSSNVAPNTPSSLGPASLVDGSFGTDNTPTLNFTLSDPDAGDTVKFQIQIDNSSDFGSAVVDYTSALGAQSPSNFTVGQAAGAGSYTTGSEGQTLAVGSYYWRVKTIDNSNAESSYATANSGSIAFQVGATVPGFLPQLEVFSDSLLINEGASSTNTREVTLTLKANNVTYMMICDNLNFSGCFLEHYQITKDWVLSEGDGEKTVYVRLFGRSTYYPIISANIILDTTLPPEEVPEEEITPEEEVPEGPIKEMTLEELQQKITEISTFIAQLKAQLQQLLEKEVTEEIPTNYRFAINLKYDQTNDDVRYLQIFLKAQGKEIYPEGIVSGWFGPLTKKTVTRFQEEYAQDILAPWELTEGTGYVGETTRAKINEILRR